jgi:hypothetical protein
MNAEQLRLEEAREQKQPWKKWGPYLSERQWGTVREDYSADGDAWSYFTHDQARSRAYRWGEDGLAGLSDDHQRLCFALALWNGKDPILKERLFGLTNSEGNHGEDVKECYYYLDATPTHSYLKGLYKYPQRAFPYAQLVEENRRRGKDDPEFELIDTDAFEGNRYFDVVTEYEHHVGPLRERRLRLLGARRWLWPSDHKKHQRSEGNILTTGRRHGGFQKQVALRHNRLHIGTSWPLPARDRSPATQPAHSVAPN